MAFLDRGKVTVRKVSNTLVLNRSEKKKKWSCKTNRVLPRFVSVWIRYVISEFLHRGRQRCLCVCFAWVNWKERHACWCRRGHRRRTHANLKLLFVCLRERKLIWLTEGELSCLFVWVCVSVWWVRGKGRESMLGEKKRWARRRGGYFREMCPWANKKRSVRQIWTDKPKMKKISPDRIFQPRRKWSDSFAHHVPRCMSSSFSLFPCQPHSIHSSSWFLFLQNSNVVLNMHRSVLSSCCQMARGVSKHFFYLVIRKWNV